MNVLSVLPNVVAGRRFVFNLGDFTFAIVGLVRFLYEVGDVTGTVLFGVRVSPANSWRVVRNSSKRVSVVALGFLVLKAALDPLRLYYIPSVVIGVCSVRRQTQPPSSKSSSTGYDRSHGS
ncbi:hypothetical protein [Halomicrococcus sp. SG-WS-1]|uniref:hypothetical protein n=1 Tax=Halomicrococcus sp. SG-WS-1 TaxID=3439057 RepID=UPI003F79FD19